MSVCWLALAAIVLFPVASESALPYVDDRTPPEERKYHAGVVLTGVRHHGGAGLGLQFEYGAYRRAEQPFRFSFESLFLSSGERRIDKAQAYNEYFRRDTVSFAPVHTVYETFMSVNIGGAVHYVVSDPPPWLSIELPGLALGLAGGVALETDRVGLLSSEYVEYYGYDSYADTDFSLRPYVRPKLVLTNGPLSLSAGVMVFTKFMSWHVGIAYGW